VIEARSGAELLLATSRPDRPRRLGGRELAVEAVLCCVVAACAIGWPVATAPVVDVPAALACVLAYAAAARVCFYVGGGCAMATQLALVPMLWTLPPAVVPLCVASALVLAALPDVVVRGEPVERLMTAIGDAAFSFAPAIVLVAAGMTGEHAPGIELMLAAFAAQCGFDAAVSTFRESLSRGIRPSVQVAVMAMVWGVDALLLPLALALGEWTERQPLAVLAVLPFTLLLTALARDRNRRLGDASDRLGDLERERERVRVAIHRVARSLGAGLDRRTVLEVALGTAVDAVGAAAGRARLVGDSESMRFEAIPRQPGAVDADALGAAERAALAGHATCTTASGDWHAMARSLMCRRDGRPVTIGAIAVCRAGVPFSRDDHDLLSYLAAQTTASIESIGAHERLGTQDAVDELTGLANRRRFQDLTRLEVDRAVRSATPLSLLLIELDGLVGLEELHGNDCVDAILRDVGALVCERCRITDEPARYSADRIGVVLAGTTIDGAWLLADDIRAGIAGLRSRRDGSDLGLTASVGLAELGGDLTTREEIVSAAEAATHEASRSGGDRTVGFVPTHGAADRRGAPRR
jgi:diguanylate cyclase (GGDEF)-like protein